LCARGKTRAHLPCLNVGLRALPRERRLSREGTGVTAKLDAIAAAARTTTAGSTPGGRSSAGLAGRRATSKLPALIDLVLAVPLATAGLIAKRLKVTPRAAQDLVAELGLRELTGLGEPAVTVPDAPAPPVESEFLAGSSPGETGKGRRNAGRGGQRASQGPHPLAGVSSRPRH
jgi:HTH DNA binding domain